MSSVREASARALGRAVSAHVQAARATRDADSLHTLLDAQVGQDGVAAIAVYGGAGELVDAAGEGGAERTLPRTIAPGVEQAVMVHTERGAAILVVVPSLGRDGPPGSVATLLRTDPRASAAAPLLPLVALYTAVVALALLVFAYFAMTRLVVQPIDKLSNAARRVAEGGRRLEVPRAGARELVDLGAS